MHEEELLGAEQRAEATELVQVYDRVHEKIDCPPSAQPNAPSRSGSQQAASRLAPSKPSLESQPSSKKQPRHHQFSSFSKCNQIKRNQLDVLANQNAALHSTSIQASTITSDHLHAQLQPLSTDFGCIKSYNKTASPRQQLQVKNGFVYKDLYIREDWLDYEDSSDDEGLEGYVDGNWTVKNKPR